VGSHGEVVVRVSLLMAVFAAMLLSSLACPVSHAAEFARRDTVLVWDDGSVDDWMTGTPWNMMAIRFQAPDWATHVTEIQFYVRHSGSSGSSQFHARVWARTHMTSGSPGDPVSDPVLVSVSDSSWHWVSVSLPAPVSIEDPLQFPDRWFYAGLEWLDYEETDVGLDLTEPCGGMTWYFMPPDAWIPIDGDAMIRTVVSDDSGSAVHDRSWSRIKSLFN
jgi:hypothetical protein